MIKNVIEWFFQRVTGALLLFGLILHFYTMHYSGDEELLYEAVSQRLSSPQWIIFNFLFLVSAVYHGFNGLLGIMIEYIRSDKMQKVLETGLIIVALFLILVGTYILTL